jgi:hypothetical protein
MKMDGSPESETIILGTCIGFLVSISAMCVAWCISRCRRAAKNHDGVSRVDNDTNVAIVTNAHHTEGAFSDSDTSDEGDEKTRR